MEGVKGKSQVSRDGEKQTWKHTNKTLVIFACEIAALSQDEQLTPFQSDQFSECGMRGSGMG
jgi:hypothetical protein